MYSVFVTRALPGQGLERLREFSEVAVFPLAREITKEELLQVIPDHDAVITMLADPIDADVIAASRKLKVIANYAVGFNNINITAATARGIAVVNTPDVLTDASADFAWALLLAAARRVVEADSLVRRGLFTGWAPEQLLGVEVHGKTLGIIGAGRIGQAVAKRAQGFGMRVLYHNRSRLPEAVERELSLTYVDLETLLKEADFITLHCPLTAETRRLIGTRELQLMKPSAVLINTSRGPVVDEAALVQALREKWIYGAGLDVYECEPDLYPGLAELPNVVLAPHIASAGRETRLRMVDLVVNDVIAVLQGERPRNLVNPEIFAKEDGR